VGSLISSPVSKIFARRYRWMLMAVRLGMGVCYLVLVSRTGLGGFALWYFGAFLFNGMANSPEASLMNSQVPADRRSTLLSFASLIMQFGGLSGSLFLGYLANSRSITMAWILAAFVLIASAAFYVFIPPGQYRFISFEWRRRQQYLRPLRWALHSDQGAAGSLSSPNQTTANFPEIPMPMAFQSKSDQMSLFRIILSLPLLNCHAVSAAAGSTTPPAYRINPATFIQP
jgi:MFS family permease